MERALKKLVTAANRASSRTRFGHYPMAPSVGLSDKEIERHRPALEANGAAAKALEAAGLVEDATFYKKMVESHSWVVNRRGTF